MKEKHLTTFGNGSTPSRVAARQVESLRPATEHAEWTPGGPPYRLLWCRITSGAPANPPDERYYADEVRPTGVGQDGQMEWEAVPGGLEHVVVHNVAEAASRSHALAADTILAVEERIDRSEPPDFVYLAYVPAPSDRLARILSYSNGAYTVQPVRREAGGYIDEGSPIAGVKNIGELWPDEAGYLAGPSGYDRYVRLFSTPAGWTILLHPPRMV